MRLALLLLSSTAAFGQTLDLYGGYSDIAVGEPRCAASGEAVFSVSTAAWNSSRGSTVFTLSGHKVNSAGAEVKISGATGGWAALNYDWPTVKTWTVYKISANQFEIPGLDSSQWGALSGPITLSACFFDLRLWGNRWTLVTPKGNLFFVRSLQGTQGYAIPGYPKYPAGDGTTMQRLWGEHYRQRLLKWGFNADGPYHNAYGNVPAVAPYTKIPLILLARPSTYSGGQTFTAGGETYPNPKPNNLWCATPRFASADAASSGQLMDVYDPNWAIFTAGPSGTGADGWFALRFWPDTRRDGGMNVYRENLSTDPWVLAVTIDDGDNLYGVSGGYMTFRPKAHVGFVALCSRDPFPTTGSSARGLTPYCAGGERENHTKLALRDFLKVRYGEDVGALNAAWGSGYTSWDHDGGWGTGTGLLDEDGRNDWVCGAHPCTYKDLALFQDSAASPANAQQTEAFKRDLQEFGAEFVRKYGETTVRAWKGFDPNHLVFGPDTLNGWGFLTHPSYLPGFRDAGFDAYWLGDTPDWTCELGGACNDANKGAPIYNDRSSTLVRFYDVAKKPVITWLGSGANDDSALAGFAPRDITDLEDYPTQEMRAERSYAAGLRRILTAQGADGVYFGIGLGWWQVHDRPQEHHSWGVASPFDNWYDGVHAAAPPPIGPTGYPNGWSGAATERPSTCEAGDFYWSTNESEPRNFYVCGVNNNWQPYACAVESREKFAVQSVSGTTLNIGTHDILRTDRAVVWDIPGFYRYCGTFAPSAVTETSVTTTTNNGMEASVGGKIPNNRGWVAKVPSSCTSGQYLLQKYRDNTWNLFYCSSGSYLWWRRDDRKSGDFLTGVKAANDSIYRYLRQANGPEVPAAARLGQSRQTGPERPR